MKERVTRRQLMAAAGVGTAGLYAAWPVRVAGSEPSMLRYYYRVPRSVPRTIVSDVCVYGGTSAGIAAAVVARRLGRSVSVAAFGRRIGGLSASGLGATDTGRIAVIGGVSREFYRRAGERYGLPETFRFEPHVAEEVFEEWVAEHGIDVYREQRLDTVRMSRDRILELRMESGLRFRAAMFIDATYEGDLLARAGTSWFAGREGNAAYGETLNGVQFRSGHQFRVPVDPYVVPGDASSGLLAGISADPPGTTGDGDHRIQAFNFRVCLTRAADRLPFPKPAGYDANRYALLLRYIEAGVWDVLGNNQPMPNGKTDWNNNGAVSSDNIGRNYDWPDTDYWDRERIFQDHVTYQQGLLWFLANDPRVPAAIRAEVGAFGLPRDEFRETGGWPHDLYIREARRMVSEYVMTEHDCRGTTEIDDPVGLASYTMDSHNCKRVVVDGRVRNEGDVQVPTPAPFSIAYRSIVPRAGECANLLVPVCLSASHIAYGSIRMEPVFMVLAQAAATAASLAIDAGVAVQEVGYAALRRQLLRDRAVLEWPPPPPGLTVSAPELRPGEPATVTVTLVNDDVEAYERVELALTTPDGWSAVLASPAADRIEPGDSAEATWRVVAPAQAEPAAAGELRARARYMVAGSAVELEAVEPVYVVEPVGAPLRTFASTEAHFGARGDRLAIIAGGADLWTGVDEYGALFLDGAGGPGTVAVTRLVSQDPTDPNARAGLAMRNDLTGAGKAAGYVLLVAKPQNGFLLLWDADGSGTVESVARSGPATTPSPAWLRLARNGSTFTGAWSVDGVTWTTVGSATVPSAAAVQDVGVVCCSHAAALGRAVFDGLEVRTSAG
jgi:FAD dependent oxidoreductase/NPCBM-associated, NEW3 domain of alpha-galactosidase